MNNINFINYFKACLKKCFLFLFIFFIENIDSRADENIWFHSNGNYQSQKYSDLNQINQSNVKSLKLNWTYRNGYVPQGGENKKYIKHITRNSIYGDDYMPLIIDEDVIMYGLHGGPEWQGGSYDKYNSQIIIPVNNYAVKYKL